MKMTYLEQLKHPNWQRRRLEILQRANWECESCGDREKTLNVHHKRYVKGRMVWDYDDYELVCLCEYCHKIEHQDKELFEQIVAMAGSSGYDQALGLVAGYFLATGQIDPPIAYSAYEGNEMFYELGVAAAALEMNGVDAWRDMVRDANKKGLAKDLTVFSSMVEMWDEKK